MNENNYVEYNKMWYTTLLTKVKIWFGNSTSLSNPNKATFVVSQARVSIQNMQVMESQWYLEQKAPRHEHLYFDAAIFSNLSGW